MRHTFVIVSSLLLALVAAPRGAHAQAGQLKPFKIEGHKIPAIKPPEQPSYKIAKPEPYKVTRPDAAKSYGGQPILKAPPPAPVKKAVPARKSPAGRRSARKSA